MNYQLEHPQIFTDGVNFGSIWISRTKQLRGREDCVETFQCPRCSEDIGYCHFDFGCDTVITVNLAEIGYTCANCGFGGCAIYTLKWEWGDSVTLHSETLLIGEPSDFNWVTIKANSTENKLAKIHEAVQANPDKPASEIAKDIDVTATLVDCVKAAMKKKADVAILTSKRAPIQIADGKVPFAFAGWRKVLAYVVLACWVIAMLIMKSIALRRK